MRILRRNTLDIIKAVFNVRTETVNWCKANEDEAYNKIAEILEVPEETKSGLKYPGGTMIETRGTLEWSPEIANQMFKYLDEDLREVGIIDVPVTMDLFTIEYYP